MYKEDLALNNLHRLICRKTKPNYLNILAYLKSAVVWMIPILSPTSNSSILFSRYLGTIQGARTTIEIIVTFMFYSFCCSQARSKYLSISLSCSHYDML